MTRWDQRVQDHPAMATLDEIREKLDGLGVPETVDDVEAVERIRQVVLRLQSLVADADASLLTPGLLNAIQANGSAIPADLETYSSEHDQTDLEAANSRLDSIIDAIGWPLAYAPVDASGYREAATNYRRAAGQLLKSIETDATGAQSGVADVKAAVADAEAAITQAVATAEVSVAAAAQAAEQRAAAITAQVDAEGTRFTTLSTQYQTEFLSSEKARAAAAEAALAEQVEKHDAARLEAGDAFKDLAVDLGTEAKGTLGEIADYREQSLTLVNTIGAIGYSGAYGSYAHQQGRAANFWSASTVLALVGLIAYAVWFPTQLTSLDWTHVLLRAAVSLPGFAIVVFAARQASRHRDAERGARQRELTLASIDPYLARLEPDARDKIKSELAMKMFTEATPTGPKEKDSLVEGALEVAKEAVKRN